MRLEFNHNPGKMEGLHILAIFGIIALLLARFFPFEQVPFTLCHFRAITGLPCPTCGMTTCFIHMTHGDFLQGAASSPLGVLVFLGTIAAIVFMIGHRIWKWPSIRLRMNRTERIVSTILLLLMLAANWAYNILHLAWHKI